MKEEHKHKEVEPKRAAEEHKKKEAEAREPETESEMPKSEIEKLKAEVEKARKEASENKDQALRAMAELNNATKRLFKEKEDFIKYSSGELAKKLIPMLDDFENALKVGNKTDENFVEGIKLIQRNMKEVFEKEGLVKQEAVGKKFDPNLHEVVATAHTENEKQEGIIAEELRSGYMFKDIVLRPAMVKIYKKMEPETESDKEEQKKTEDGGQKTEGKEED